MLKKDAPEKITTHTKKGQPQTREKEKGTRKNTRLQFTQNTHSRAYIASHPHKKNTAGLGFAASSIISSWAEVVPFPLQPWTLTWELWEFSSLVGVLGVSVSPPPDPRSFLS